MFHLENQFQQLIHEQPEIILSGIPEINAQYCPDVPSIVSLGKEIPLKSGRIDNLYIDPNAIITFVECKRYSDGGIKRGVYAQAINYASDLSSMLMHYTAEQFLSKFFRIIQNAIDCPFVSLDDLIDRLSEDPILKGRHLEDWRNQFIQRLEHNIKRGIFRIVMACTPSPDNVFAYSSVRNLIQFMNYSQAQNDKYDLILMDVREENDNYISKIIWRSYTQLPQIPLIAQATRNTAAGIEKMRSKYDALPATSRQQLDGLISFLTDNDAYLVENTYGFAIYSEKNKKSLYTNIEIDEGHWRIVRHQIRDERLSQTIEANQLSKLLPAMNFTLNRKTTGKGEPMFEISISPRVDDQPDKLGRCILDVLGYSADNRSEILIRPIF